MRRSIISLSKWEHNVANPPTTLSKAFLSGAKLTLGLATKFLRMGRAMHINRPPEEMMRMPRLLALDGKRPMVQDNCFIAPSASIIGDVQIGRKCYIGYNAIIRADPGQRIVLGESCNVQEKAVITGAATIGKWTSIEPMAIIESADVAAGSFVGANAVVGRGAIIESEAMLCAGSVLQAGATIPSGEMWAGNPAQCVGQLSEDEKHYIIAAAKHQVLLNIEHHDSLELPWEMIDNMRIARELWAISRSGTQQNRLRPQYVREPPMPYKNRSKSTTPYELVYGNSGIKRYERPTQPLAPN